MPSFVCDRCQETLKKPKLDAHVQRCRGASFSCIDCYRSFSGVGYRDHFSCISEVEKYEKRPKTTAARAGPVRSPNTFHNQLQPGEKGTAPPAERPATVEKIEEAPARGDATDPVEIIRNVLSARGGALSLRKLQKVLKKEKKMSRKDLKKILSAIQVSATAQDGIGFDMVSRKSS